MWFLHDTLVNPMRIQKQDRRKIFEYLFNEGCIVIRKDFQAPSHEVLDIPNLQVIKALESLKSLGMVELVFSWQRYYYSLTFQGIEFLRDKLRLDLNVVPNTLKVTKQVPGPVDFRGQGRAKVY